MKVETWIFGGCSLFFLLVAPAYWFITYEPVGTTALTMTLLLTSLITFYLGFHARRMDPRPEDRKDAEIADGAGELGFFPPYSWWPLWSALTLGVIVLGMAMQLFWLAIIGGIFGVAALSGWIFEYYVGDHAH
jgi:multisubunit Na+/H+ antiporter MnhC subunit